MTEVIKVMGLLLSKMR